MSISVSGSYIGNSSAFGVSDTVGTTPPFNTVPYISNEIWGDKTKTVEGVATAPTDNSLTINEPGATLAAVGIVVPSFPVIRVTGVLELTSGQVDVSDMVGFSGVVTSLTASGPFTFELTSAAAVGFKRSFSSGAVCTITDIRVYEVLSSE